MWNAPVSRHRSIPQLNKGSAMGTILLIILILLLLGAVPSWPYSRSWGYRPAGLLGVLLIVLLVLLLLNVIPWGFTYHTVP
jgi:hypothetical protein